MLLCAEKFVERLKEDGMNPDVTIKEDFVGVNIPHDGKEFKMIFQGENGEYLSQYFLCESIPAEKRDAVILACNEINRAYKWIKLYVDSDNDLMYQVDAKLSPETAGEEALEMILRMANITDEIKTQVMKAIYA